MLPHSIYVVECFLDKAVGVAMASDAPIFVADDIQEGDAKMVLLLKREHDNENGAMEDDKSLSRTKHIDHVS